MSDAPHRQEDIEIVDGGDLLSTVTSEDLQLLTRNLLSGIFSKARIRLSADQSDITDEQRMQLQDASERWHEQYERVLSSVTNIAEKGDLSIIRVNGMVAGMAGYAKAGVMPDGRDVYEIKRVSVLPDFREKKLGSQLMSHVAATVQKAHPDSPVLMHTKNPSVLAWAQRCGFRIIPFEQVFRIWNPDVEQDEGFHSWKEQEERAGWRGLLRDPLERK